MKAILVSKRFNPGHISHIEANAKLLEDNGYDVLFSLNNRFMTFHGTRFKERKASISDYINLQPEDFFIVWYSSISALVGILLLRLLRPAKIVYVYHEPFTSYASYRDAGFSRIKTLRIAAISLVSKLMCLLSHKTVLPSTRAYSALSEARNDPERYAKINLLFSDESRPDQLKQKRDLISYIGTIAEDHAFEEFVHLMHHSICNDTLEPYKYLIATRSSIPSRFSSIINHGVTSGRLLVQSGIPMTNDQINDFYAKSYVVWNAYKRSMQSGVLPKAYMFGTPVMMSTANKCEYFEDGHHGALISDDYSIAEFEEAILNMEPRWHTLSKNCRAFFLKNFDYRALSKTFMIFLTGRP